METHLFMTAVYIGSPLACQKRERNILGIHERGKALCLGKPDKVSI